MHNRKIKKLILGTNNQGKVREIKNLLPKYVISDTPKKHNIRSPKEIGSSFLENSLIKAKYFSRKTKAWRCGFALFRWVVSNGFR